MFENLSKPFLIAELSGNHNGDINRGKRIIECAAKSGADAVKLQTYTPETMTIKSDKADFQITSGLWADKSLWDLYDWAHTPFDWHEELFDYARSIGITCFSSPFDETAVDLLESLDCPFYKIASFELTDTSLINYVASKGKPMIISTGMANLEEIQVAYQSALENGAPEVVLLHCISGYPTPTENMNLRKINKLSQEFNTPIGLSDHSMSNIAAISSIGLGVKVIEKHITYLRSEGGPDSEFSLEPDELKKFRDDIDTAYAALGDGIIKPQAIENENIKFRRSIYAIEDIKAGEKLSPTNIGRIRPGYGISAKHYSNLIGKPAIRDIERGDPITPEFLE